MLLALLLGLILLAAFLPQLWVRWVMQQHGKQRPELAGTGGELARHLLRRFDLQGYVVEEAPNHTDHFDPAAKTVRLGKDNFHGKSLTAVAVAAHEVGHALQCHRNERIFQLRSRWLPVARVLTRVGIGVFLALPILVLVLRAPGVVPALLALGLVLQLAGAMVQLLVLPEELDASFNKALPILAQGEYVSNADLPAVRSVLRAAALTYFAGALAGVFSIGRWWLVLRGALR